MADTIATLSSAFFKPLLPGFLHNFWIPMSFIKKMNGKSMNSVVLRGCGGSCGSARKLWRVEIDDGRYFGSGWREFAGENGLQIGDFVVFRQLEDLLFEVTVFGPGGCERGMEGAEKISESVKEEDSSDSYGDENPWCRVTLTYYSLSHSILGPLGNILPTGNRGMAVYISPSRDPSFAGAFYGTRLKYKKCEMVLIDWQERSWTMILSHKKCDGQSYIKIGWREFQIANELKTGDVLKFELVKSGRKPIMKCFWMERIRMKPPPKEANYTVSYRHEHPSCEFALKPYSCTYSTLNIPMAFARSNGLVKRCCKAKLVDSKRRVWLAELAYRDHQVIVKKGWKAFCAANGFKAGDVVKLALLEDGTSLVFAFTRVGR